MGDKESMMVWSSWEDEGELQSTKRRGIELFYWGVEGMNVCGQDAATSKCCCLLSSS